MTLSISLIGQWQYSDRLFRCCWCICSDCLFKVSSLSYRYSQCVVCCRAVPGPLVVTPHTSLPRISYAGGDTMSVSVENLGVSTTKLMQVMLASKYLATAVSYTCDTVNPVELYSLSHCARFLFALLSCSLCLLSLVAWHLSLWPCFISLVAWHLSLSGNAAARRILLGDCYSRSSNTSYSGTPRMCQGIFIALQLPLN